jgi:hypothetical protein
MAKSSDLSYPAQIARERSPDSFLASLFVPSASREALLALYALDGELANVRSVAHEEMIAFIRFAWWRESLEAIGSGQPPREHPVLQALEPLIRSKHLPLDSLLALTDSYRDQFPELPPERGLALNAIAHKLLRHICPQCLPGWEEARAIIESHRERFGHRRNFWLHLRLLRTGLV